MPRIKRAFREVVAVQRRDVLLVGERDRLLRLHDFDVAGDAGGEAIARLRQLLRGEIARLRRDLQLLVVGLQIEERARGPRSRCSPSDPRLRSGACGGRRRPRASRACGAAALEDRHVDRADDREGRLARRSARGRCRRSRRSRAATAARSPMTAARAASAARTRSSAA